MPLWTTVQSRRAIRRPTGQLSRLPNAMRHSNARAGSRGIAGLANRSAPRQPEINLLIAWTSVATFLIYSIFMMKAARTNPRAGSSIAKGSFSAMVSFSICAGIHLLLTITLLIGLSGEWALYFLMLIRFAIHAAMITGLVLLIKSCFSATAIYRL